MGGGVHIDFSLDFLSAEPAFAGISNRTLFGQDRASLPGALPMWYARFRLGAQYQVGHIALYYSNDQDLAPRLNRPQPNASNLYVCINAEGAGSFNPNSSSAWKSLSELSTTHNAGLRAVQKTDFLAGNNQILETEICLNLFEFIDAPFIICNAVLAANENNPNEKPIALRPQDNVSIGGGVVRTKRQIDNDEGNIDRFAVNYPEFAISGEGQQPLTPTPSRSFGFAANSLNAHLGANTNIVDARNSPLDSELESKVFNSSSTYSVGDYVNYYPPIINGGGEQPPNSWEESFDDSGHPKLVVCIKNIDTPARDSSGSYDFDKIPWNSSSTFWRPYASSTNRPNSSLSSIQEYLVQKQRLIPGFSINTGSVEKNLAYEDVQRTRPRIRMNDFGGGSNIYGHFFVKWARKLELYNRSNCRSWYSGQTDSSGPFQDGQYDILIYTKTLRKDHGGQPRLAVTFGLTTSIKFLATSGVSTFSTQSIDQNLINSYLNTSNFTGQVLSNNTSGDIIHYKYDSLIPCYYMRRGYVHSRRRGGVHPGSAQGSLLLGNYVVMIEDILSRQRIEMVTPQIFSNGNPQAGLHGAAMPAQKYNQPSSTRNYEYDDINDNNISERIKTKSEANASSQPLHFLLLGNALNPTDQQQNAGLVYDDANKVIDTAFRPLLLRTDALSQERFNHLIGIMQTGFPGVDASTFQDVFDKIKDDVDFPNNVWLDLGETFAQQQSDLFKKVSNAHSSINLNSAEIIWSNSAEYAAQSVVRIENDSLWEETNTASSSPWFYDTQYSINNIVYCWSGPTKKYYKCIKDNINFAPNQDNYFFRAKKSNQGQDPVSDVNSDYWNRLTLLNNNLAWIKADVLDISAYTSLQILANSNSWPPAGRSAATLGFGWKRSVNPESIINKIAENNLEADLPQWSTGRSYAKGDVVVLRSGPVRALAPDGTYKTYNEWIRSFGVESASYSEEEISLIFAEAEAATPVYAFKCLKDTNSADLNNPIDYAGLVPGFMPTSLGANSYYFVSNLQETGVFGEIVNQGILSQTIWKQIKASEFQDQSLDGSGYTNLSYYGLDNNKITKKDIYGTGDCRYDLSFENYYQIGDAVKMGDDYFVKIKMFCLVESIPGSYSSGGTIESNSTIETESAKKVYSYNIDLSSVSFSNYSDISTFHQLIRSQWWQPIAQRTGELKIQYPTPGVQLTVFNNKYYAAPGTFDYLHIEPQLYEQAEQAIVSSVIKVYADKIKTFDVRGENFYWNTNVKNITSNMIESLPLSNAPDASELDLVDYQVASIDHPYISKSDFDINSWNDGKSPVDSHPLTDDINTVHPAVEYFRDWLNSSFDVNFLRDFVSNAKISDKFNLQVLYNRYNPSVDFEYDVINEDGTVNRENQSYDGNTIQINKGQYLKIKPSLIKEDNTTYTEFSLILNSISRSNVIGEYLRSPRDDYQKNINFDLLISASSISEPPVDQDGFKIPFFTFDESHFGHNSISTEGISVWEPDTGVGSYSKYGPGDLVVHDGDVYFANGAYPAKESENSKLFSAFGQLLEIFTDTINSPDLATAIWNKISYKNPVNNEIGVESPEGTLFSYGYFELDNSGRDASWSPVPIGASNSNAFGQYYPDSEAINPLYSLASFTRNIPGQNTILKLLPNGNIPSFSSKGSFLNSNIDTLLFSDSLISLSNNNQVQLQESYAQNYLETSLKETLLSRFKLGGAMHDQFQDHENLLRSSPKWKTVNGPGANLSTGKITDQQGDSYLDWTPSGVYANGQVVTYLGKIYIAKESNSGVAPNTEPPEWSIVQPYHASSHYQAGDYVYIIQETLSLKDGLLPVQPDNIEEYTYGGTGVLYPSLSIRKSYQLQEKIVFDAEIYECSTPGPARDGFEFANVFTKSSSLNPYTEPIYSGEIFIFSCQKAITPSSGGHNPRKVSLLTGMHGDDDVLIRSNDNISKIYAENENVILDFEYQNGDNFESSKKTICMTVFGKENASIDERALLNNIVSRPELSESRADILSTFSSPNSVSGLVSSGTITFDIEVTNASTISYSPSTSEFEGLIQTESSSSKFASSGAAMFCKNRFLISEGKLYASGLDSSEFGFIGLAPIDEGYAVVDDLNYGNENVAYNKMHAFDTIKDQQVKVFQNTDSPYSQNVEISNPDNITMVDSEGGNTVFLCNSKLYGMGHNHGYSLGLCADENSSFGLGSRADGLTTEEKTGESSYDMMDAFLHFDSNYYLKSQTGDRNNYTLGDGINQVFDSEQSEVLMAWKHFKDEGFYRSLPSEYDLLAYINLGQSRKIGSAIYSKSARPSDWVCNFNDNSSSWISQEGNIDFVLKFCPFYSTSEFWQSGGLHAYNLNKRTDSVTIPADSNIGQCTANMFVGDLSVYFEVDLFEKFDFIAKNPATNVTGNEFFDAGTGLSTTGLGLTTNLEDRHYYSNSQTFTFDDRYGCSPRIGWNGILLPKSALSQFFSHFESLADGINEFEIQGLLSEFIDGRPLPVSNATINSEEITILGNRTSGKERLQGIINAQLTEDEASSFSNLHLQEQLTTIPSLGNFNRKDHSEQNSLIYQLPNINDPIISRTSSDPLEIVPKGFLYVDNKPFWDPVLGDPDHLVLDVISQSHSEYQASFLNLYKLKDKANITFGNLPRFTQIENPSSNLTNSLSASQIPRLGSGIEDSIKRVIPRKTFVPWATKLVDENVVSASTNKYSTFFINEDGQVKALGSACACPAFEIQGFDVSELSSGGDINIGENVEITDFDSFGDLALIPLEDNDLNNNRSSLLTKNNSWACVYSEQGNTDPVRLNSEIFDGPSLLLGKDETSYAIHNDMDNSFITTSKLSVAEEKVYNGAYGGEFKAFEGVGVALSAPFIGVVNQIIVNQDGIIFKSHSGQVDLKWFRSVSQSGYDYLSSIDTADDENIATDRVNFFSAIVIAHRLVTANYLPTFSSNENALALRYSSISPNVTFYEVFMDILDDLGTNPGGQEVDYLVIDGDGNNISLQAADFIPSQVHAAYDILKEFGNTGITYRSAGDTSTRIWSSTGAAVELPNGQPRLYSKLDVWRGQQPYGEPSGQHFIKMSPSLFGAIKISDCERSELNGVYKMCQLGKEFEFDERYASHPYNAEASKNGYSVWVSEKDTYYGKILIYFDIQFQLWRMQYSSFWLQETIGSDNTNPRQHLIIAMQNHIADANASDGTGYAKSYKSISGRENNKTPADVSKWMVGTGAWLNQETDESGEIVEPTTVINQQHNFYDSTRVSWPARRFYSAYNWNTTQHAHLVIFPTPLDATITNPSFTFGTQGHTNLFSNDGVSHYFYQRHSRPVEIIRNYTFPTDAINLVSSESLRNALFVLDLKEDPDGGDEYYHKGTVHSNFSNDTTSMSGEHLAVGDSFEIVGALDNDGSKNINVNTVVNITIPPGEQAGNTRTWIPAHWGDKFNITNDPNSNLPAWLSHRTEGGLLYGNGSWNYIPEDVDFVTEFSGRNIASGALGHYRGGAVREAFSMLSPFDTVPTGSRDSLDVWRYNLDVEAESITFKVKFTKQPGDFNSTGVAFGFYIFQDAGYKPLYMSDVDALFSIYPQTASLNGNLYLKGLSAFQYGLNSAIGRYLSDDEPGFGGIETPGFAGFPGAGSLPIIYTGEPLYISGNNDSNMTVTEGYKTVSASGAMLPAGTVEYWFQSTDRQRIVPDVYIQDGEFVTLGGQNFYYFNPNFAPERLVDFMHDVAFHVEARQYAFLQRFFRWDNYIYEAYDDNGTFAFSGPNRDIINNLSGFSGARPENFSSTQWGIVSDHIFGRSENRIVGFGVQGYGNAITLYNANLQDGFPSAPGAELGAVAQYDRDPAIHDGNSQFGSGSSHNFGSYDDFDENGELEMEITLQFNDIHNASANNSIPPQGFFVVPVAEHLDTASQDDLNLLNEAYEITTSVIEYQELFSEPMFGSECTTDSIVVQDIATNEPLCYSDLEGLNIPIQSYAADEDGVNGSAAKVRYSNFIEDINLYQISEFDIVPEPSTVTSLNSILPIEDNSQYSLKSIDPARNYFFGNLTDWNHYFESQPNLLSTLQAKYPGSSKEQLGTYDWNTPRSIQELINKSQYIRTGSDQRITSQASYFRGLDSMRHNADWFYDDIFGWTTKSNGTHEPPSNLKQYSDSEWYFTTKYNCWFEVKSDQKNRRENGESFGVILLNYAFNLIQHSPGSIPYNNNGPVVFESSGEVIVGEIQIDQTYNQLDSYVYNTGDVVKIELAESEKLYRTLYFISLKDNNTEDVGFMDSLAQVESKKIRIPSPKGISKKYKIENHYTSSASEISDGPIMVYNPSDYGGDKATKVTLGDSHAIILTESGKVYGLGDNSKNQIDKTFTRNDIFNGLIEDDILGKSINNDFTYLECISNGAESPFKNKSHWKPINKPSWPAGAWNSSKNYTVGEKIFIRHETFFMIDRVNSEYFWLPVFGGAPRKMPCEDNTINPFLAGLFLDTETVFEDSSMFLINGEVSCENTISGIFEKYWRNGFSSSFYPYDQTNLVNKIFAGKKTGFSQINEMKSQHKHSRGESFFLNQKCYLKPHRIINFENAGSVSDDVVIKDVKASGQGSLFLGLSNNLYGIGNNEISRSAQQNYYNENGAGNVFISNAAFLNGPIFIYDNVTFMSKIGDCVSFISSGRAYKSGGQGLNPYFENYQSLGAPAIILDTDGSPIKAKSIFLESPDFWDQRDWFLERFLSQKFKNKFYLKGDQYIEIKDCRISPHTRCGQYTSHPFNKPRINDFIEEYDPNKNYQSIIKSGEIMDYNTAEYVVSDREELSPGFTSGVKFGALPSAFEATPPSIVTHQGKVYQCIKNNGLRNFSNEISISSQTKYRRLRNWQNIHQEQINSFVPGAVGSEEYWQEVSNLQNKNNIQYIFEKLKAFTFSSITYVDENNKIRTKGYHFGYTAGTGGHLSGIRNNADLIATERGMNPSSFSPEYQNIMRKYFAVNNTYFHEHHNAVTNEDGGEYRKDKRLQETIPEHSLHLNINSDFLSEWIHPDPISESFEKSITGGRAVSFLDYLNLNRKRGEYVLGRPSGSKIWFVEGNWRDNYSFDEGDYVTEGLETDNSGSVTNMPTRIWRAIKAIKATSQNPTSITLNDANYWQEIFISEGDIIKPLGTPGSIIESLGTDFRVEPFSSFFNNTPYGSLSFSDGLEILKDWKPGASSHFNPGRPFFHDFKVVRNIEDDSHQYLAEWTELIDNTSPVAMNYKDYLRTSEPFQYSWALLDPFAFSFVQGLDGAYEIDHDISSSRYTRANWSRVNCFGLKRSDTSMLDLNSNMYNTKYSIDHEATKFFSFLRVQHESPNITISSEAMRLPAKGLFSWWDAVRDCGSNLKKTVEQNTNSNHENIFSTFSFMENYYGNNNPNTFPVDSRNSFYPKPHISEAANPFESKHSDAYYNPWSFRTADQGGDPAGGELSENFSRYITKQNKWTVDTSTQTAAFYLDSSNTGRYSAGALVNFLNSIQGLNNHQYEKSFYTEFLQEKTQDSENFRSLVDGFKRYTCLDLASHNKFFLGSYLLDPASLPFGGEVPRWSAGTYNIGDRVFYKGFYFECIEDGNASVPSVSSDRGSGTSENGWLHKEPEKLHRYRSQIATAHQITKAKILSNKVIETDPYIRQEYKPQEIIGHSQLDFSFLSKQSDLNAFHNLKNLNLFCRANWDQLNESGEHPYKSFKNATHPVVEGEHSRAEPTGNQSIDVTGVSFPGWYADRSNHLQQVLDAIAETIKPIPADWFNTIHRFHIIVKVLHAYGLYGSYLDYYSGISFAGGTEGATKETAGSNIGYDPLDSPARYRLSILEDDALDSIGNNYFSTNDINMQDIPGTVGPLPEMSASDVQGIIDNMDGDPDKIIINGQEINGNSNKANAVPIEVFFHVKDMVSTSPTVKEIKDIKYEFPKPAFPHPFGNVTDFMEAFAEMQNFGLKYFSAGSNSTIGIWGREINQDFYCSPKMNAHRYNKAVESYAIDKSPTGMSQIFCEPDDETKTNQFITHDFDQWLNASDNILYESDNRFKSGSMDYASIYAESDPFEKDDAQQVVLKNATFYVPNRKFHVDYNVKKACADNARGPGYNFEFTSFYEHHLPDLPGHAILYKVKFKSDAIENYNADKMAKEGYYVTNMNQTNDEYVYFQAVQCGPEFLDNTRHSFAFDAFHQGKVYYVMGGLYYCKKVGGYSQAINGQGDGVPFPFGSSNDYFDFLGNLDVNPFSMQFETLYNQSADGKLTQIPNKQFRYTEDFAHGVRNLRHLRFELRKIWAMNENIHGQTLRDDNNNQIQGFMGANFSETGKDFAYVLEGGFAGIAMSDYFDIFKDTYSNSKNRSYVPIDGIDAFRTIYLSEADNSLDTDGLLDINATSLTSIFQIGLHNAEVTKPDKEDAKQVAKDYVINLAKNREGLDYVWFDQRKCKWIVGRNWLHESVGGEHVSESLARSEAASLGLSDDNLVEWGVEYYPDVYVNDDGTLNKSMDKWFAHDVIYIGGKTHHQCLARINGVIEKWKSEMDNKFPGFLNIENGELSLALFGSMLRIDDWVNTNIEIDIAT